MAPAAIPSGEYKAAPNDIEDEEAAWARLIAEEEDSALKASQEAWQQRMEAQLGEPLRDELFEKGVSKEVINALADSERDFMKHIVRSPWDPANHGLRTQALQLTVSLLAAYGLELQVFYEAVLILDAFHSKSRNDVEWSGDTLPNICFAIVRMLDKVATARRPQTVTMGLAPGQELIQSMTSGCEGYKFGRLSDAGIAAQEHAILALMQWELPKTTAYSWLCTLGSRLVIISRGSLASSLSWVWRWSTSWTHSLAITFPSSASMCPVRVARGLFCMGLILAGVAPPRIFKPTDMDDETWAECLGRLAPPGGGMLANNVFPESHSQSLLEVIQVAACIDEVQLRQDVKMVAAKIVQTLPANQAQAKGGQGPPMTTLASASRASS